MTFLNPKMMIPVLALLITTFSSQAAEKNVADQAAIAKWIQQLDADSLTKRQKARTQLTNAGQSAIPALTKAALSDKRDLIAHSVDILAEIAKESNVAETRKAATVALSMLSESDKPSTAQRAKLALQAEKDNGIAAFPGWDQPGGEFGGANSFANQSVSVSSINGIKTITVKEAGKSTKIQGQPLGGFRVQITGAGQPKQFVAKDLDELKKKDPAAFALFQQYGGNAGGHNLAQFGGFGLPGGFGNNMNIMANQGLGNGGLANGQMLDINNAGANPANAMMIQHLTELKKRMAGNPQMQQILDQQIKDLQQ